MLTGGNFVVSLGQMTGEVGDAVEADAYTVNYFKDPYVRATMCCNCDKPPVEM
jgi:hypothetical protein